MSIEIFLDNYNNIRCYPGKSISGRIECTFNSKTNLRAIRVEIWGSAKTTWYESESQYRHKYDRSVQYYAEEVYINAVNILVQGSENFSLPAGKHVYPFSYILPPQLPSSFEGTKGYIRYYVKAVVDRSWKFDYKAKVPLNVVSIIDLNFIPHIRELVTISDNKNICTYWGNDGGTLAFTLYMPISGYAPRQDINIRAYVKNMTNVSVKCIKFNVVANYEYIAHRPSASTRNDSGKIAKCVESGIVAHGEKFWTSTLRIPTNQIYPNLIPCSIIKARYNLVAKVVLPFPYINLELLDYPITIGSVALSDVSTAISGPSLPDAEFALSNDLPLGYPPPNNVNGSYPTKYPDGGMPPPYEDPNEVPPQYLSRGGKGASTSFAPMNGLSSNLVRTNISLTSVVPSYPPPEESPPPYYSISSELPPYLLPSGGSTPCSLSVGGSVPYPASAGESTSFLPLSDGSTLCSTQRKKL